MNAIHAMWRRAVLLIWAFGWAPSWALAQALQVDVVDHQGRVVPDAVVSIESAVAQRAVQPMAVQQIVQKHKAFSPAVLPVTRGTPVIFPNEDTVRHHVYSFSTAKRFELKLYVGTPAEPVVFDRPGVVVLGCNIHDDMVAWVVVLDTPWFAMTDVRGRAALHGMPAGDYTVRVWHARLPANGVTATQAVRWSGAPQTLSVTLQGLMPL